MDKLWFEMQDLIKKEYDKSVWIPLCAYHPFIKQGEIGYVEYKEEFLGAGAVMFDIDKREQALQCQWSEVNRLHDNRPYADEHVYFEAGRFEDHRSGMLGKYLVLQQCFDYGDEIPEWHLSQDFVLALGLSRKKDTWVSPAENYLEVARLKRNKEGSPCCLEVRAEHLKDYLSARKSGILLSRYHSRHEIVEDNNAIGWEDGYQESKNEQFYRWEGRCYSIHEGSCSPYGTKVAVFQTGRADVDYNEDVPTYGFPSDNQVWSKNKTVGYKGKKLFFVSGELWKTEWISPAELSPRVRGDEIESKISFIVDNEGKTLYAKDLKESGRYLWFNPKLVKVILGYPKAFLKWYTEDTGQLGFKSRSVHFGVNSEGFINVYAKDIALLPENDKKIWGAYNASPDGGVSQELLMSQVEAKPVRTIAPERLLIDSVRYLNKVAQQKWNKDFFRKHYQEDEILAKIHRFQAIDMEGVCILSKELTRFIIERINHDLLRSLTKELDKTTGSLKRLEKILSNLGIKGREVVAPLAGIYELRKADAHLPSEDFKEAIFLIGVESDSDYLTIGKQIIYNVAERIYLVGKFIAEKTLNNTGRKSD